VGKISKKTPLFGKAFESYLFHELKSATDYLRRRELKFWRTQVWVEVDFIYSDRIGIEVKGKETITDADLKGLQRLAKEKVLKRHVLLYLGPALKPRDSIEIMNYQDFLDEVWEE